MTSYRALTELPPLVVQAQALAEQQQFAASCRSEVGRVLATLAATVTHGPIGEIGTGYGVGTAWLTSGLQTAVRCVTVERDETRACAVAKLFAEHETVQVVHGDWRDIVAYGPFALLFADTPAKYEEPELLLGALQPGGILLLDDLTPEEHWPDAWRGRPDPGRSFWLNNPRVIATEILTTATTAMIIATRIC